MKKLFLLVACGFLLVTSCHKYKPENNTDEMSEPFPTERKCAAYDVLEEQLKADPSLQERMNKIEEFTRHFASNPDNAKLVNGVMEVPVVVNVLYKTASENISQAQIQSQIDVLNEDYGAHNADYNRIPSVFAGVASDDINIHFALQNVVRKQTNKKSWSTNDAMKKSAQGGIDPTSPSTTLNIWVCTLGNGLLGYAQFPGGNSATDGVVILNRGFGRTGTATAPYDKGRTATHEIGHYFNLRHIWGDDNGACSGSDLVNDTPNQANYNFGCPSFPHVTCSNGPNGGDMFMNYMDYTDDACMFMFSGGQKTRMQATYAPGGPRASLIP